MRTTGESGGQRKKFWTFWTSGATCSARDSLTLRCLVPSFRAITPIVTILVSKQFQRFVICFHQLNLLLLFQDGSFALSPEHGSFSVLVCALIRHAGIFTASPPRLFFLCFFIWYSFRVVLLPLRLSSDQTTTSTADLCTHIERGEHTNANAEMQEQNENKKENMRFIRSENDRGRWEEITRQGEFGNKNYDQVTQRGGSTRHTSIHSISRTGRQVTRSQQSYSRADVSLRFCRSSQGNEKRLSCSQSEAGNDGRN